MESKRSECSSSKRNYQGPRLSYLPREVLLEIFNNLDGKSLVNCKRVCRNWREQMKHLEKGKNFWYKRCQNEIPPWVQSDLLDNIYPSHWRDVSQVDWEVIYMCWYNWDSPLEILVVKSKVVNGVQGISSVKVSGEWLLLSTCEGRGTLFAQRLTETDSLFNVCTRSGQILNFELVLSDKRPCSSNMVNISPVEEMFESLEHNQIWLDMKDCYIVLGKSYYYTLDKTNQKISHSYGYELRLKEERSLIVFKKICCNISGPEMMEFELLDHYSTILDCWKNKVALHKTNFDRKVIVDAVSCDWTTQQVSYTASFGVAIKNEYCQTYSWQASLFVVFTNRRKIVISYNGEVKEQVTPIQKGCVTSVLFYANHLFLGTDRGKLMIFKVKNPKDCLKIEVHETPCWDIEVCERVTKFHQLAIRRLAIAEPVQCKRKTPVVVCGTSEDVYLVSLNG